MVYDASEPPDIPEESLTCELCGQKFDTVESLNEHKMSEVKDHEIKYKGAD
jgi:tRNA U54 and U55 pseudouridine synthase Pus10